MTTATNPEYTDVVQKIGQMLFQALWEQEQDLDKKVRELDNIVNQSEWRQVHRHVDPLVHGISLEQLAALARG